MEATAWSALSRDKDMDDDQVRSIECKSLTAVALGRLTENGSGRIITGETGLAHTRTNNMSVSVQFTDIPHPRQCVDQSAWLSSSIVASADNPTARMRIVEFRMESHPLSITRAATSSVIGKTRVSRGHQGEKRKRDTVAR